MTLKTQLLILITLFLFTSRAFSNNILSLTISETSEDHWKKGKYHAIEASQKLDYKNYFDIDTLKCIISAKYSLGVLYQYNEDDKNEMLQPTTNEIFLESMVAYPVKWKIDPYISVSVRTPLVHAYQEKNKEKIYYEKFWDPVISNESIGFSYMFRKDDDYLISRIGINLKQTRAEHYPKLTDDVETEDVVEKYKAETGFTINNELNIKVDSLSNYKSSLVLFGVHDNLEVWSVKFENEFNLFLWKFILAAVEMDLVYDEKQTASLQYRQKFSLGLSLKI